MRERAALLTAVVSRIDLRNDCIMLSLDPKALSAVLGLARASDDQLIVVTLAAMKVRCGHQLRLVIPGPRSIDVARDGRDAKLVALVAEAHTARQLVLANPSTAIATLAANNNRCRTRLGKLASLACLAPDIVRAIVEGRQPPNLTARVLQDVDLPLAWPDQRALLGFG